MKLQLTAQVEHKCEDCKLTIEVGDSMIRTEHKSWPDYKVEHKLHHLKCWQEKQGRRRT